MIFFIFLLLLLTLFIYHKNTIFENFKKKNIEHIDNIENIDNIKNIDNIENINITISNKDPYYNPFDYGYYFLAPIELVSSF